MIFPSPKIAYKAGGTLSNFTDKPLNSSTRPNQNTTGVNKTYIPSL
jgi:hypothetical protein